jgi:hypothetical protein
MSKIVAALREAIGIFEDRGLVYAVMGGLAVRTHGIPRPTWDIDFTLSISRDDLISLFDAFEDLGYSVDDAYRAGWVDTVGGMPLVKVKLFIGSETLPIDIFLAETPFQDSAMSRRMRASIFDVETWAVSPEDLVLFKLTANRYRDLGDALDVLFMQGQLDVAYMRFWAKKLGTSEKLEELLEHGGQV